MCKEIGGKVCHEQTTELMTVMTTSNHTPALQLLIFFLASDDFNCSALVQRSEGLHGN